MHAEQHSGSVRHWLGWGGCGGVALVSPKQNAYAKGARAGAACPSTHSPSLVWKAEKHKAVKGASGCSGRFPVQIANPPSILSWSSFASLHLVSDHLAIFINNYNKSSFPGA